MTAEERQLRHDLDVLAGSERGRLLLQLALRGIQRGDRAVTAGCWTDQGIAGCLFQHAYWQGVEEGVFSDEGRPGDWIGSFVGPGDYGIVVRAIGAFDQLAKSRYADIERRRLVPDRVHVRQGEWKAAVERMLVEALAGAGEAAPERRPEEVVAGH
ncbi:MAG TPA: hypothetical protein VGC71_14185 [Gaiellales bacterium]|jgi:hypothetical protein